MPFNFTSDRKMGEKEIILYSNFLFFLFSLLLQHIKDLEKLNCLKYPYSYSFKEKNVCALSHTLPDTSILVLLIAKLRLPGVKKRPCYYRGIKSK